MPLEIKINLGEPVAINARDFEIRHLMNTPDYFLEDYCFIDDAIKKPLLSSTWWTIIIPIVSSVGGWEQI